jgi:hypothetical protein
MLEWQVVGIYVAEHEDDAYMASFCVTPGEEKCSRTMKRAGICGQVSEFILFDTVCPFCGMNKPLGCID